MILSGMWNKGGLWGSDSAVFRFIYAISFIVIVEAKDP